MPKSVAAELDSLTVVMKHTRSDEQHAAATAAAAAQLRPLTAEAVHAAALASGYTAAAAVTGGAWQAPNGHWHPSGRGRRAMAVRSAQPFSMAVRGRGEPGMRSFRCCSFCGNPGSRQRRAKKNNRGIPQLALCAGCMQAEYCSSECQKAHWFRWHKLACQGIKFSVLQRQATLQELLQPVHDDEPTLSTLSLPHCSLGSVASTVLDQINTALAANTRLIELNLRKNSDLARESFARLFPMLTGDCNIFSIRLDAIAERRVDREALQQVCEQRLVALLQANDPRVTQLDLRSTYFVGFGDDEAQSLAAALARNTQLQAINMTFGHRGFVTVGAAGQSALLAALGTGHSGVVDIVHDTQDGGHAQLQGGIDPRWTREIGKRCWENALRRIRANDPTLRILDLSNNRFL